MKFKDLKVGQQFIWNTGHNNKEELLIITKIINTNGFIEVTTDYEDGVRSKCKFFANANGNTEVMFGEFIFNTDLGI